MIDLRLIHGGVPLRVAAVLLVSLGATARAEPASAPPRAAREAADASVRLAGRLLRELPRGNAFFSPTSISLAVGMTHAGARGATAQQLARVLGAGPRGARLHEAHAALLAALEPLSGGRADQPKLRLANALWVQRGAALAAEFAARVRTSYRGHVEQVDFAGAADAARVAINGWVERSTEGLIRGLLPAGMPDAQTRLLLTSAVHFKGRWRTAFPKRATRDGPFSLAEGGKIVVPLMHLTASLRYRATRVFEVLELPYRGDRFSMIVLLPRRIGRTRDVERYLEPRRLEQLLRSLPRRMVEVFLPRFSARHDLELAALLQRLGARDAFSTRADFSAIDGTPQLFLQAVLHRALVDVDEEGTEAAAATAVLVMAEGEGPPEPPVFRADRPFVYLIRDRRTGNVLFAGRLARPRGAVLPRDRAPARARPRTGD